MKTGKYRDSTEFYIGNSTFLVTMGCPRLYNTPEEKKAAKATNSERSYARFAIYSVPAQ